MLKENLMPEVNLTTSNVKGIIRQKIADKEPFALTRFGDGEIVFLREETEKQEFLKNLALVKDLDNIDDRMISKWSRVIAGHTIRCGLKWPEDLQTAYDLGRKILLTCLNESDIIGLTPMKHELLKVRNWLMTKERFRELGVNIDKKLICHHLTPRLPEFSHPNEMAKLLNGTPVHIISFFVEDLKKNKIDELLQTSVTFTQTKNSGVTHSMIKDKEDILKILPTIDAPIVLYGYSLVGKDIGIVLKNKYKKICIDMGATLGAWGGIYERTAFKEGKYGHKTFIKKADD